MATVLVADDERDMRALLTKLLGNAGHDVIEAVDGRSALELAITHQPDVILLDVSMPAMGGLEVLKKLRETPATQGIPAIFLSAHPVIQLDRERQDLNAGAIGATSYITKPWKRGAIERAIKHAVANPSGNR